MAFCLSGSLSNLVRLAGLPGMSGLVVKTKNRSGIWRLGSEVMQVFTRALLFLHGLVSKLCVCRSHKPGINAD